MNRALWLTAAFYSALFIGIGAHLPFWPLWLFDWGLSDAEIGQFLGLAIFARILGSTLVPSLADRFAIRRLTLALAAGASALIILLHFMAGTKAALLALTIGLALTTAALIPTGEALGLRAAQSHRFSYAHARAIGSAAFLLTVLLLGTGIDHFGVAPVPIVILLSLFAAGLLGLIHPGGGAAPGELDQASTADAGKLLCNPVFWIFAAAFALGQASHAVLYTYSTIHWREAGLSGEVIGGLWAIGVAAEIALMFGAGRWLVGRLGPTRALGLAALAGVIRWSVMIADPPLWLLWPVQSLHAFTFGLSLLAGMAFLAEAIPRRLGATAQGVTTGLIGGSTMALATLLAGLAAPDWSQPALYWIALIPSATGLSFCFLLSRFWKGGPLQI
ncbi:MAG: MFS transporter [Pseudomonadota bacterium]